MPQQAEHSKKPIIELKDICKNFASVKANNHVNLTIEEGEIHALLGENGSGKSTMVSILSGIYTPDSGQIYFGGEEVVMGSPKAAIDRGIGMVHQHFKLVEVLTAKENIVAGTDRGLFTNQKKLTEEIYELGKKYGLIVNPDKKVYNMSVSEKQTVEILKVLYRGAKVLILDEPTAVLTPQETETLFEILRQMKADGCSIILITHKLSEVMQISDRVTVLRKGESISTVTTADVTPRILTEMMVGRAVELEIARITAPRSENPVLEVSGVSALDHAGFTVIDDMTFDLYGGEIFGVAGIAGSGQKELCEIIAGIYKAESGHISFKGREILGLNPREITKLGIGMSFIPEDRLGMGLVAGMSVTDNVILKSYRDAGGLFVDRQSGAAKAENIVERFEISTPGVNHIVKKLSGGNIQKVLLGREIELEPSILITAYPVRGLDIGASYRIYDILNEQKAAGVAVMFIGEDLDVLLSICDRLMVIHDGKIMGILDPAQTNKDEVGLLMMGITGEEDAQC